MMIRFWLFTCLIFKPKLANQILRPTIQINYSLNLSKWLYFFIFEDMTALSKRIHALAESQTIKMAKMGRDLAAKGIDIINLSFGEPDFNTPDYIKDAAKKAGKAVVKGATVAGKAVGKGATVAGKAVGKGATIAAKATGKAFKSAGKAIGKAFKKF
jgi:hypothetical protein